MNTLLLALAAAAIALGSPTQPPSQQTCPVHVPATAQAARSAEFLNRVAPAICEFVNSRNEHVASLWVYPTNKAHTVYVQYTSTKTESSVDVEHLAVARMKGDRIAHWQALP